jgi:membrane protein implicated in regulation of membrane protease activity
MDVSPMRPWQNALAIMAAFLVAGALLPWELRLACAFGAIGIVLILLVSRLRVRQSKQAKARTASVYGQVERIRADRKSRLNRRNPLTGGRYR